MLNSGLVVGEILIALPMLHTKLQLLNAVILVVALGDEPSLAYMQLL